MPKSARGRFSRPKKAPYREGKKPDPVAAPSGVFLPDKEMLVRLIAMKGASDEEIEQIFMCPRGSVAKWRAIYPTFAKALENGRSHADTDVMYAFYKNCVGYNYVEQQAVGGKDPRVMSVERYRPPDFAAQKFWLQNRMGYKNVESREHSGPGGGPIGYKAETRNELIDSILGLVNPKPDAEADRPKDDPK